MPRVSYSNAVEEIKAKANIVDVIGALVPLKRAGSTYKACCPFHKEKTPSFVVSESKQFYHCFGCGESGDVISFVMKYYNIDFREAVERLALQYNVRLETEEENSSVKKKDAYYEVNRLAARFFFDSLTKKANPGFAYMKKRGMEPATITEFGIGYADDSWNSLTEHLLSQGASEEILLELGLSRRSDKGRLYDYFRDRVVFPIIDTKGKVTGFGARMLQSGEPKYLNSQESIVFLKKNNLFGLNLSKNEIQKEGFAILVEGYMDVVGLYQGGVRNVAASLGTALTENQARLIKRYTNKVVLCYDSDAPGIKAAFVGIDVLRAAGIEVRVAQVDDGKDPDEYIKRHGKDEFYRLIETKSRSDVDYKVFILRSRYDLDDTVQGIRFLQEAAGVLRDLPPVEQDVYIQKVSKDYHISEGALRSEVARAAPQTAERAAQGKDDEKVYIEQVPVDNASLLLEKTLIRLSLLNGDYFRRLSDYREAFVSLRGMEIRDVLEKLLSNGGEPDLAALREELSDPALNYLDDILLEIQTGDRDDEAFEDCLFKLRKRRAERRQQEIMDILSLDDGSADREHLNALMNELTQLQKIQKRQV